MNVIEVRPCKKFKGAWVVFEAPGVEPAFPDPNGKQDAILVSFTYCSGYTCEIALLTIALSRCALTAVEMSRPAAYECGRLSRR